MSGFMERLAGRSRGTGGGVRPYAPRFAADSPLEDATEPELEEPEEATPAASPAAPPRPAVGTSSGTPVVARYALSVPSPVASTAFASLERSPSTLDVAVAPHQTEALDRSVPADRDVHGDAAWVPESRRPPPPAAAPAAEDAPPPETQPARITPGAAADTSVGRRTPARITSRSGDPGSPVPERPPGSGDHLVPSRADLAGVAAPVAISSTPPAGVALAIRSRPGPASPTVHVTIGRVDVRAVLPPPGGRPVSPAPKPPISLDEYLRQRDRGER